jgi:hypothetical protein
MFDDTTRRIAQRFQAIAMCLADGAVLKSAERWTDGATRAFYEANGFILTRDFPGYWKSGTPVLMVRPLIDMKG